MSEDNIFFVAAPGGVRSCGGSDVGDVVLGDAVAAGSNLGPGASVGLLLFIFSVHK